MKAGCVDRDKGLGKYLRAARAWRPSGSRKDDRRGEASLRAGRRRR